MNDHFISMRYRTDCYHCHEVAAQLITAVPYRAQVVCDNCGATRVFVPRLEDVVQTGAFSRLGKYPVWKLVENAACRNCHFTGSHDVSVGTRHLTVQCRNCGFAHFYKFDLEYIAKETLNG